MNAFESFDIGAWSLDGLTHHVENAWSESKPRRVRVAANIRLAVAGVAAAAVLTISAPWLSEQTQSPFFETAAASAQHSLRSADVILGSPVEYWSRVSAAMHSWPQVSSDQTASDPPPFI
jgi:hypothetical protein